MWAVVEARELTLHIGSPVMLQSLLQLVLVLFHTRPLPLTL